MTKKAAIHARPLQSRSIKARESLVVAALLLFGAKGFQATSTREIAQKARQNIAAIPYYFGNKEGLYVAAMECGLQSCPQFDENTALAKAALLKKAAPEECLAVILQWTRSMAAALATTDKRTISFMKLIMREQIAPSPAFNKSFQQVFVPTNDVWVGLVARYLCLSPTSQEAMLVSHALMGPFHIFKMMPEVVLQRMGIKKIGATEAATIAAVITEQVETALLGMRARRVKHA